MSYGYSGGTLLPSTGGVNNRTHRSSLRRRKTHRSNRQASGTRRKYSYKPKRRYYRKAGERYTPHTAGKRKDTSHKRIRYTKNGQPYIIMGNGRARFIKKSSADRSHKKAGGRY